MTDSRQARCPYCGTTKPSDPGLPFFEDRGEGSRHATTLCHCGYALAAHDDDPRHAHVMRNCADAMKGKGPRGPHEFDSFYCGCRGWD
jgi:hypothetical protein